MLNRFRITKSEKGQGLTEYVLILAFIAGVAFMMFGGDGSLKGTLVSTVTKTNNILAGLFGDGIKYADALKDWGKLKRSELEQKSARQRLAADQEALTNLGSHFLNMTKSDLLALLKMSDKEDEFDSLNNDGKGILVFNYVDDNLNELKNNNAEAIKAYISVKNLNASASNVVDWMKNDGTTGYAYDNKQRYFYSDTMIDPLQKNPDTTPTSNADYSNNQERSVRLNFAFDGDNVSAVRVRVNRDGTGNSDNYLHGAILMEVTVQDLVDQLRAEVRKIYITE